jgi:hypothetical protein
MGRESKVSLYQLDLSTHKVTDVAGSEGLWIPLWSHDGKYLWAVTSAESPAPKIYEFATQRWTELGQGALGDVGFYPDGKAMFYSDQAKQEMFRIRLTDHKVEQIADLHSIDQPSTSYWPAWTGVAPDGSPLLMRNWGTKEICALELEK